MSLILEALRRADSERGRGAVPGLHAQPVPAFWAPKGVYDVHLVTITVDWEAKKLNYNEFDDSFEVTDLEPIPPGPNPPGPNPPPGPTPTPTGIKAVIKKL